MENGSFQHLKLSHLDFSDFEERSPQVPQLREHQILDFDEIPKDLRKSSTVETLLAQNEDMMARLKITIRSLSKMEDENRAFSTELSETKRSYASISDQMLIWKEKERLWKERNQKLEEEIKTFKVRFPDYLKMEAQIDRLKKYQEKVKTTIKPYLQQLKDYAQSLLLQIQNQNKDLDIRDTKIHSQDQQIQNLKDHLKDQSRFYEMSQNDLVSGFEKTKQDLRHEISVLQEINQALEFKTQSLDRAMERQDELENLVIALRRSKTDFQTEINEELQELRNQNRELKQTLTEKNMSAQDLAAERDRLKEEVKSAFSRKEELEEQLTSLRFMWTSKSEENEKMKISLSSLEKINLELSGKLNELRKAT